MKKYIGLILYLVGLVLLSYTFFYLSERKTAEETKESSKLSVASTGQVFIGKNDLEKTSNTGVVFSGEENQLILSGDISNAGITNINSGMTFTGDLEVLPLSGEEKLADNQKNSLSGTILYKNPNFEVVEVSPYDDIFDILGYKKDYTYQFKGEDIYLKVLKSVDYENEKSNINQLIQQIGGNIKETNLFGERQFFINIDAYYGKVVIMVVKYNKNLYLLVMPYSLYKKEKNYFKKVLFAK